MNMTNTSTLISLDHDTEFSSKLAILQGSIYIPIFFAGIINNAVTILVMLLNKDMHTVTNCYLLNLAISDSLPLIVSLPFEITFFPIELPWREVGCKLRSLLAETSTNASILTISAFTIERYLAVCHPLYSSYLSTTQRARKIQIFVWFLAILSSVPYFYMTKQIDQHCNFDPDFRFFVKICFYLSAIVFFVLPVFILCVLYALMAQRLYSVGVLTKTRGWKSNSTESYSSPIYLQRINHDSIKRHRHSSTSCTMPTRYSGVMRGPSIQIRSMKKSAFKMLFAVVIAFIICYAPFHTQRLITSSLHSDHLSLFERRAIIIFYFISGIFYYFGSIINPIFYHLFSRKYRRACLCTMKRLIHCQHHRDRCSSKADQSPSVARLVFYRNTHLPSTTNYRSLRLHQTSFDMTKTKYHDSRYSLPALHIEQM